MSDTIITSDTPSMSSHSNSTPRIFCLVCQKQVSQYTCPRCNTRYCSLPCYKSHSLSCTESFARENVMGELQQLQPDDQSKQKMLEILERLHSEEEMEGMDEMDEDDSDPDSSLSEETIQKILSGSQMRIDDLPVKVQKQIQRAIASGELSKLIEPWDPWWLKPSAKYIHLGPDGTQLVQPLSNSNQVDEMRSYNVQDLPSGPAVPLPSVRKLRAAEPSPLLAVHLVDIIYSYCFTLRLYNGDWMSDPVGSALDLLRVSSVLGQGAQPITVFEALSHCLEGTCSSTFRHVGGLQFGMLLMDDVIRLLYLGGGAIVCLLCDLQRLIQAADKELKWAKSKERVECKTNFKSLDRKVYFIMCWVHEQPNEAWSSLAAIVKGNKSSFMEHAGNEKGYSRIKEKVKAKDKPSIQEIA